MALAIQAPTAIEFIVTSRARSGHPGHNRGLLAPFSPSSRARTPAPTLNSPVFTSLFPVILFIAIGFYVGRRGWIRAGSVKDLANLVFMVGAVELMREIKRALDPKNILNPGKIFD